MIILINGPFGIGKTTAASILNERIKNSLIFDPEEVGTMLRKTVKDDIKYPEEKTDDFQDIILWKELTVTVAERLLSTYKRDLIIPMTIYDPERFRYIISGLKKADRNTFHFCLLAQRATIEKRLLKRGEEVGSWAFRQTEKCLFSFEQNRELFEKIIYTDNLSVEETIGSIMETIC